MFWKAGLVAQAHNFSSCQLSQMEKFRMQSGVMRDRSVATNLVPNLGETERQHNLARTKWWSTRG